ncbi:MAG: chorismate lyase [Burkholderiales bacterium]|nr:chorismate lyase [Burkholderiales bacterium]MCW5582034.1 chorismate lyase [Luteimonas sp.]
MNSIPRDSLWCAAPVAAGPLRRWLTDPGSLTARLERHAGRIAVQVLFQGRHRPNADEAFLFAGRTSQVMVREVLLLRGAMPLVFAHTVFDAASLRGAWRGVSVLGNRPLGAALFADPRIARFPLRQKKLAGNHPLYRGAAARLKRPPPSLWARRSIFAAGKSPILVSEVFLPAVFDL